MSAIPMLLYKIIYTYQMHKLRDNFTNYAINNLFIEFFFY